MEPRSVPNPSPEMGTYRAPEAQQQPGQPETVQNMPEKAKAPEAAEMQSQPSASGPMVALPQLPTLPNPQPISAATQHVAKNSSPTIAADEDVIEKEWVDKAKKIVAETKDDPYRQEKEVSKLQADYIKKRYGKEIKLSSD